LNDALEGNSNCFSLFPSFFLFKLLPMPLKNPFDQTAKRIRFIEIPYMIRAKTLNVVTRLSKILSFLEVKMRGGRRTGAGRKKKPDHLRRELVTIRLPQWMISQLKNNGEIGYLIEIQLAKKGFLDLPDDYDVNN